MEYIVFFNVEYLFYTVHNLLTGGGIAAVGKSLDNTPTIYDIKEITGATSEAVKLYDVFTIIVILLSLVLLVGIVYAVIRISQIRKGEKKQYLKMEQIQIVPKKDSDWTVIDDLSDSNNPKNWESALERADKLLLNKNPDINLDEYNLWNRYTENGSDLILTKEKTKEFIEKYKTALGI